MTKLTIAKILADLDTPEGTDAAADLAVIQEELKKERAGKKKAMLLRAAEYVAINKTELQRQRRAHAATEAKLKARMTAITELMQAIVDGDEESIDGFEDKLLAARMKN